MITNILKEKIKDDVSITLIRFPNGIDENYLFCYLFAIKSQLVITNILKEDKKTMFLTLLSGIENIDGTDKKKLANFIFTSYRQRIF